MERGDALFELGEVALENLAPPALVAETGFDPAQRLRNRLILLLQTLESPIDLVEVPEHLAAELGDLTFNSVKPAVNRGKATICLGEATVYLGEATVYLAEPTVYLVKPAVYLGELASQEVDELLILG
ncbi:MAG TPA: hypothetical protein VFO18_09830 [Methylomirabilota bacterium]|nr:hypothetical protein [Methylomirabilota bacterium]